MSRLSPRALAIALVLLVVLDVLLYLPLTPYVPWDFRLPDRTLMGFDQYVQSLKANERVRIAVVGSSIMWGGFADPDDTLSSWMTRDYREQGRNVQAFNLGMNGARANDLYTLTASLTSARAVDMILLNFDYHFFNDNVPFEWRYPELKSKVASWAPASVDDTLVARIPASEPPTPTIETRLSTALSRVWKLYAERDYLDAIVFGGVPRTEFGKWAATLGYQIRGRPWYRKKPASRLPLRELKTQYAVEPFTNDDIYIQYLAALLLKAQHDDVPVVVFAGPLNTALLDKYRLWDRAAYARNVAFVRQLVESRGGGFLDLTASVPGSELGDTHHPLSAGYRRLASELIARIDPLVRELESTRGTVNATSISQTTTLSPPPPLTGAIPWDFRMPSTTLLGFDEFVAHMRTHEGVRIATVGDSLVWGGHTSPPETLASWMTRGYRAKKRKVEAFNFGMARANSNELYNLSAALTSQRAVDLILLNFNYRFYANGVPLQWMRPQLRDKVLDWAPLSPDDPLIANQPDPPPSLETTAAYETKLRRWLGTFARPSDRVYKKKPASALPIAATRQQFLAVQPLSENDIYMRYLIELIRKANRDGVRVVVFTGPLDVGFLRRYKMWDRAAYNANIARVRSIVRREGAGFIDLTNTIPGANLGDTHHPLSAGYKAMAALLIPKIDTIVRQLEASRTAGARTGASATVDASAAEGASATATATGGGDRCCPSARSPSRSSSRSCSRSTGSCRNASARSSSQSPRTSSICTPHTHPCCSR